MYTQLAAGVSCQRLWPVRFVLVAEAPPSQRRFYDAPPAGGAKYQQTQSVQQQSELKSVQKNWPGQKGGSGGGLGGVGWGHVQSAARMQPVKVPRSLCALYLRWEPVASGPSRSVPSEAPPSSRPPGGPTKRERERGAERENARLPPDCTRGQSQHQSCGVARSAASRSLFALQLGRLLDGTVLV